MTAYQIINLRDCPGLAGPAARWFHEKWRIPLEAYEESIAACLAAESPIPQWYLAVTPAGEIIGGMGAIENDFHKRKDLTPNVCAVYTEESWRGQGVSRSLLNHVCADLAGFGIIDAYLLTDHTGFTSGSAGTSAAWRRRTAAGRPGCIIESVEVHKCRDLTSCRTALRFRRSPCVLAV